MNRFAALLDRLSYERSRNNKLRLIADYLRATPDPERGWALAALTGALSFKHAKAGVIRALITERSDPALFALSYDYVGDLSETVALMWPAQHAERVPLPPRSGGEGLGVGGSSLNSNIVPSTPDPSPPLASLAGGGEQKAPPSPPSSKHSSPSARRNCRRRSRAGSTVSTRPGAGRF
jgi:DNA ligase-1